ncbi:hypothetical protein OAB00_01145 [Akkermansiaceae bacterium]|nr:hypothetical protein [Akkermansiaceae bacterium]
MIDPVSIYFTIEATDHLGKNKVTGKVRFLSTQVELSWRLAGSVFTGGKGDINTILLPYGEVESVEVVKKWFSIKRIIMRVGDPTLLGEMPSVEMGKMELIIDKRSKGELNKLSQLIDFKRSEFILDMHEQKLEMLRNSE